MKSRETIESSSNMPFSHLWVEAKPSYPRYTLICKWDKKTYSANFLPRCTIRKECALLNDEAQPAAWTSIAVLYALSYHPQCNGRSLCNLLLCQLPQLASLPGYQLREWAQEPSVKTDTGWNVTNISSISDAGRDEMKGEEEEGNNDDNDDNDDCSASCERTLRESRPPTQTYKHQIHIPSQ